MSGSSCSDFGLPSGGNRDLWFPADASSSPYSTSGDSLNFTFTLQESDRTECRTVTFRIRDDSSNPNQQYYARIEFPQFEFGSPSYNVRPCGDGVTSSQQCRYKTCRNCINPRKRWVSVSDSRDVCYRDARHKCGNAGDEVVGSFTVPFPVVVTIVNTDWPDLFGFDEGYFTAVATIVRPPTDSPTAFPTFVPTDWRPPSPYPTVIKRPERPAANSTGGSSLPPSGTLPSDRADSSGNRSNSAVVIAVSAIVALVVLNITCAFVYIWFRRTRSKAAQPSCTAAYAGQGQSSEKVEDACASANGDGPSFSAYAPSYGPTETAMPAGGSPGPASTPEEPPFLPEVDPSAPPLGR